MQSILSLSIPLETRHHFTLVTDDLDVKRVGTKSVQHLIDALRKQHEHPQLGKKIILVWRFLGVAPQTQDMQ